MSSAIPPEKKMDRRKYLIGGIAGAVGTGIVAFHLWDKFPKIEEVTKSLTKILKETETTTQTHLQTIPKTTTEILTSTDTTTKPFTLTETLTHEIIKEITLSKPPATLTVTLICPVTTKETTTSTYKTTTTSTYTKPTTIEKTTTKTITVTEPPVTSTKTCIIPTTIEKTTTKTVTITKKLVSELFEDFENACASGELYIDEPYDAWFGGGEIIGRKCWIMKPLIKFEDPCILGKKYPQYQTKDGYMMADVPTIGNVHTSLLTKVDLDVGDWERLSYEVWGRLGGEPVYVKEMINEVPISSPYKPPVDGSSIVRKIDITPYQHKTVPFELKFTTEGLWSGSSCFAYVTNFRKWRYEE